MVKTRDNVILLQEKISLESLEVNPAGKRVALGFELYELRASHLQ